MSDAIMKLRCLLVHVVCTRIPGDLRGDTDSRRQGRHNSIADVSRPSDTIEEFRLEETRYSKRRGGESDTK